LIDYNQVMVDWRDYIEHDPGIMRGKPVFKGLRLTVEFILDRLAQGASERELVQNYEGLTVPHIQAALSYATSVVRP
jgi:uncharacterized protein (DUF433 family)